MATLEPQDRTQCANEKAAQTASSMPDTGGLLNTPPVRFTGANAFRHSPNASTPAKRSATGPVPPTKKFLPRAPARVYQPIFYSSGQATTPECGPQAGPCAPLRDEGYEFALNKISLIDLPDPHANCERFNDTLNIEAYQSSPPSLMRGNKGVASLTPSRALLARLILRPRLARWHFHRHPRFRYLKTFLTPLIL